MAIDWIPIPEDVTEIRQGAPILLIAKYPSTNVWSDADFGWRWALADQPENHFARWHHNFPPTHYAMVNNPND